MRKLSKIFVRWLALWVAGTFVGMAVSMLWSGTVCPIVTHLSFGLLSSLFPAIFFALLWDYL